MNCPKCNKPMETGFLYGNRNDVGPYWLPEGVKRPGVIFDKYAFSDRGGFFLEKDPLAIRLTGGHKVLTYICRDCKMGVFEYEGDDQIKVEEP